MRQSFGGLWLMGIMMTFMMIFIAFVSITMNYQNAYNIKTQLVTVIEQYSGTTDEAIEKMNRIMQNNGYRAMGKCHGEEDNFFGMDAGSGTYVINDSTNKHNLCVSRVEAKGKSYFTVDVFFHLSLPVLGDIITFKVSGTTNGIYPNDIITR